MGVTLDRARIQTARKKLGITQETLAKKVGCSKRTIEDAESGRKSIGEETLQFIAEALNVAPDELLPAKPTHGHSDASRDYCEMVIAQCKWVEFRGLRQFKHFAKPHLDDVFVPIFLARTTDLLPVTSSDLPDLPMGPVHEVYEPELMDQNSVLSVAKALRDHPALVVLGEPGAGKSTLLRFLAVTYGRGPTQVKNVLDLEHDQLPVHVSLARYWQVYSDDRDYTLEKFLRDVVTRDKLALDYFDESLTNGGCLLLLDGLDEVRDLADRAHVADQIERLVDRYPTNRVIVTSRAAGYQQVAFTGSFVEVQILPLSETSIRQFIERWAQVCSRAATAEDFGQVAKNLSERVFGSGLRRLASNPLFLTIIAITNNQSGKVPSRREELYRITVSALAEHWNQAKVDLPPSKIKALGGVVLDERYVVGILGRVAFWWLDSQRSALVHEGELKLMLAEQFGQIEGRSEFHASCAADEFLKLMLDESGLLVEREPGQISFFLPTIKEYLAARYLSELVDPARELGVKLLAPGWQEVVLFTASILGGQRLAVFMQTVLDTKAPHDALLYRNVLLATRCLVEAAVPPAMWNSVLDDLVRIWQEPVCEALQREVAAIYTEVRGTWLELQLADRLPEIQLMRLFQSPGVPTRQVQSSTSTDDLLQRLADKGGQHVWQRQEALANLLWRSRSLTISQRLLRLVRDEDEDVGLRCNAVRALTIADSEDLGTLVKLLTPINEEHDLRLYLAILQTLGRIGSASDEARKLLLNIAVDGKRNPLLRLQSVRSIADLGKSATGLARPLAEQLEVEELPLLRSPMVAALGKLGDGSTEVLKVLYEAESCEDDPELRLSAICSLVDLGIKGDAMCDTLHDLLKTVENPELRNIAWYQLLKIANASVES